MVASAKRLSTWKEIATYIGRDARTAKRYEVGRGLPVHRMPGEGKSTVYAFAHELDDWLTRSPPTADDPDESDGLGWRDETPSTPEEIGLSAPEFATWTEASIALQVRETRPFTRGAGAGLVIVAAVATSWLGWSVFAHGVTTHRPTAAAAALDLEGRYALEQRTPAGLQRGIEAFGRALTKDPADSDAYAGLATAWNLAPQFGGVAPAQAYPRAKAAALKAVALAPRSAAAHRVLAFVDFWWDSDTVSAWREFRTALVLEPTSAEGRHWYANALGEMGDPRAVTEIERAQALAPASTAIVADKGWILMSLRRLPEARTVLRQVLDVEPGYAQAHAYMADLESLLHENAASLREGRLAATLRLDVGNLSVVDAGERALLHGETAMVRAMVERQRELFAEGRYPALAIAFNEVRLGRTDAALARLVDAKARREPGAVGLAANPALAGLRSDPRFQALAGRASGV